MWWGLREQGGHAVAEAVWIWVPKGAGPLEKPREVRLAGMNNVSTAFSYPRAKASTSFPAVLNLLKRS